MFEVDAGVDDGERDAFAGEPRVRERVDIEQTTHVRNAADGTSRIEIGRLGWIDRDGRIDIHLRAGVRRVSAGAIHVLVVDLAANRKELAAAGIAEGGGDHLAGGRAKRARIA